MRATRARLILAALLALAMPLCLAEGPSVNAPTASAVADSKNRFSTAAKALRSILSDPAQGSAWGLGATPFENGLSKEEIARLFSQEVSSDLSALGRLWEGPWKRLEGGSRIERERAASLFFLSLAFTLEAFSDAPAFVKGDFPEDLMPRIALFAAPAATQRFTKAWKAFRSSAGSRPGAIDEEDAAIVDFLGAKLASYAFGPEDKAGLLPVISFSQTSVRAYVERLLASQDAETALRRFFSFYIDFLTFSGREARAELAAILLPLFERHLSGDQAAGKTMQRLSAEPELAKRLDAANRFRVDVLFALDYSGMDDGGKRSVLAVFKDMDGPSFRRLAEADPERWFPVIQKALEYLGTGDGAAQDALADGLGLQPLLARRRLEGKAKGADEVLLKALSQKDASYRLLQGLYSPGGPAAADRASWLAGLDAFPDFFSLRGPYIFPSSPPGAACSDFSGVLKAIAEIYARCAKDLPGIYGPSDELPQMVYAGRSCLPVGEAGRRLLLRLKTERAKHPQISASRAEFLLILAPYVAKNASLLDASVQDGLGRGEAQALASLCAQASIDKDFVELFKEDAHGFLFGPTSPLALAWWRCRYTDTAQALLSAIKARGMDRVVQKIDRLQRISKPPAGMRLYEAFYSSYVAVMWERGEAGLGIPAVNADNFSLLLDQAIFLIVCFDPANVSLDNPTDSAVYRLGTALLDFIDAHPAFATNPDLLRWKDAYTRGKLPGSLLANRSEILARFSGRFQVILRDCLDDLFM